MQSPLKTRYYNKRDVASIFGVHISTVNRWITSGKLVAIKQKTGEQKIMVSEEEINRFFAREFEVVDNR